MAKKKGKTGPGQTVLEYRHEDAKRMNIPPAGLAAQGKIREKPKILYAYNPHLPRSSALIIPEKRTDCPSFLKLPAPVTPLLPKSASANRTSLTNMPYLPKMPPKFTLITKGY